jgi:transcription elongation factor GreA
MADGYLYLSKDGYEKLLNEQKQLRVRRRELADKIDQARSHGDLSENAEYHAAKEAQLLNELRINEVSHKLERAHILDESGMSANEVLMGATVQLKDVRTGEELSYMLVSEVEADYAAGKISTTSPVGKALLGHKVDDTVDIKVPAGVLQYKVLKISRS